MLKPRCSATCNHVAHLWLVHPCSPLSACPYPDDSCRDAGLYKNAEDGRRHVKFSPFPLVHPRLTLSLLPCRPPESPPPPTIHSTRRVDLCHPLRPPLPDHKPENSSKFPRMSARRFGNRRRRKIGKVKSEQRYATYLMCVLPFPLNSCGTTGGRTEKG